MTAIFPADSNGDTLRRMQNSGDNLEIARDVDFSLIFDRQINASRFCEDVGIKIFATKIEPRDEEFDQVWDVTCTIKIIPTYDTILKIEENLQSISAPFGGQIDGWGCFSQE
jgi:hypothetical protein